MFQVTLLDHIRLSFGGVVHSYRAHTEFAERLSRRVWYLRLGELALIGGALAAAIASAIRGDMRFAVVAAVLSGIALALFTVYVAVNLEARIYAHRWCAARLWLIREKYRALLSEVRDGVLDVDGLRLRRDALLQELHAIDEHAPLLDRPVYQSARQSLATADEAVLSDEEIDRFLPQSLRKTSSAAQPAAAPAPPRRASA